MSEIPSSYLIEGAKKAMDFNNMSRICGNCYYSKEIIDMQHTGERVLVCKFSIKIPFEVKDTDTCSFFKLDQQTSI